ncbi:FecR family protein [Mangrovibacterium marinum]|uniref:FecR family protein n=1 Tax=Mangrovibacterium marinum TaxID=1639118 RepID=A0A2T5C3Y0_9BACT|nr:FecR family protein [Mangrovibacterium marinum]PTN09523.1 FecR family protein [Mangrovibacterium marinum]
MNPIIDENMLVRFVLRETTEDEDREIIQWASQAEGNREELRSFYETHKLTQRDGLATTMNVDQEWAAFYSNHIAQSRSNKPGIISLPKKWMGVAASVLLVVSLGLAGLQTYRLAQVSPGGQGLLTVRVPSGEKSSLVLSDGTIVWLNSESSLRYDANNPRKVSLTGEGYFEVSKDPSHPFIVETPSGMNIRVLGTDFNVRNYEGEPFEATLDEGKIELFGKKLQTNQSIKPGEQAVLSDGALKIKQVNSSIYSVWRNNELKFEDANFAELVPRIERWYGVTIDLDPRLATRDYFTMTVKTESIRELFKMMQLTSNFNYEINGSEVQLKAN